MSPEQALNSREVSYAADIYSLGAMFYEMLTGHPPYHTPDKPMCQWEALDRVRACTPEPPQKVRPEIPAPLQTICLKCRSKDPNERYASAAALAEDCKAYMQGAKIQARRKGWWTQRWHAFKDNPWRASLIVGIILFLASVLWLLLWTQHRLEDALKKLETKKNADLRTIEE
jgi:serine/threonine protein kinase